MCWCFVSSHGGDTVRFVFISVSLSPSNDGRVIKHMLAAVYRFYRDKTRELLLFVHTQTGLLSPWGQSIGVIIFIQYNFDASILSIQILKQFSFSTSQGRGDEKGTASTILTIRENAI